MSEPPILDYRQPPPRPKRRWGLLIWWIPSLVAAVGAGLIMGSYRSVAAIPWRLYRAYELLWAFAFWWIPAAIVIRTLIWAFRAFMSKKS